MEGCAAEWRVPAKSHGQSLALAEQSRHCCDVRSPNCETVRPRRGDGVAGAHKAKAQAEKPTVYIPMGNQREGYGHDGDRFVPISLQYQPYTADGPHVRRHSIANYPAEDHNYFGQTSQMFNGTDYDGVAYSRQAVDASGKNIPVVTIVSEEKPTIFSEIEPLSDAILVGFGVSDEAYADILMGNAEPQGLLPMQQPKDMDTVEAQLEDVPRDMECYTDSEGHTYDFAYGLNWKGVIHDARIARYDVPVLHKK